MNKLKIILLLIIEAILLIAVIFGPGNIDWISFIIALSILFYYDKYWDYYNKSYFITGIVLMIAWAFVFYKSSADINAKYFGSFLYVLVFFKFLYDFKNRKTNSKRVWKKNGELYNFMNYKMI